MVLLILRDFASLDCFRKICKSHRSKTQPVRASITGLLISPICSRKPPARCLDKKKTPNWTHQTWNKCSGSPAPLKLSSYVGRKFGHARTWLSCRIGPCWPTRPHINRTPYPPGSNPSRSRPLHSLSHSTPLRSPSVSLPAPSWPAPTAHPTASPPPLTRMCSPSQI